MNYFKPNNAGLNGKQTLPVLTINEQIAKNVQQIRDLLYWLFLYIPLFVLGLYVLRAIGGRGE